MSLIYQILVVLLLVFLFLKTQLLFFNISAFCFGSNSIFVETKGDLFRRLNLKRGLLAIIYTFGSYAPFQGLPETGNPMDGFSGE